MLLSKTPLRISFAGGGTDYFYNKSKFKGRVITTTINKFMYVSVNKRHNSDCRISYSRTENVQKVSQINNDIIREGLKLFKIRNGIELTTIADVPSSGSGLASSSALAVGVCNVLSKYMRIKTNKKNLAEKACEIEILKCKKPIGMQDQYSTSFGGFNKIEFFKNKVTVKKLKLSENYISEFNNHLLLFYTGINRKADKILSKIKQSGNQFKHFDELSMLALDFEKELLLKNFDNCGKILHKGWILKKQLNQNVSSIDMDQMYSAAMGAGAIGGKILGAGGGGYFLFLTKPKNKKRVIKSLSKLEHIDFRFTQQGSKVFEID